MNTQTLLSSSLYLSKEPFDIASVSRLYGCSKIKATEIVQELLNNGLVRQHWRESNNRWTKVFCRYTQDSDLLQKTWNSESFYQSKELSNNTPKWY